MQQVILYSNDLKTPFPLVDADPHFNRVIKYMRGSDYALWAAGAGAAPAAIYAMGKSTLSLYPSLLSWEAPCSVHLTLLIISDLFRFVWYQLTRSFSLSLSRVWIEMADPTSRLGTKGLRPTLKLATWLGFAGGFLLAYQTSSRAFLTHSPSIPHNLETDWGSSRVHSSTLGMEGERKRDWNGQERIGTISKRWETIVWRDGSTGIHSRCRSPKQYVESGKFWIDSSLSVSLLFRSPSTSFSPETLTLIIGMLCSI